MINDEVIIHSDSNGKPLQNYVKKEVLGHGGFAKCYLMVNLKTGDKFAGKVIKKKELKDEESWQKIMQEIEIHKSLSHKNICKFYEMFQFQSEIYIILELCQNNSLKEFLKNRVRITEFQAKCYLLQIINGLQYLHKSSILHRDIKLGNIFLNYKMEVKIGDFGLSTRLKTQKQKRYTTCGTPNYIAPEILNQSGHSYQVDVWAVGIILYALVVGKPPFEADTVDNTYRRIKQNKFQFPKEIPLTNDCKNLIKNMLEPNPKYRISLQDIKTHQFITKANEKIPLTMPSYTISIPPQSSYLKQFMSQKHMKLSIFPRKISNTSHQEQFHKHKMVRVLSLDKQLFKSTRASDKDDKSTLNRCHIYNSKVRTNSMRSSSNKKLLSGSYRNSEVLSKQLSSPFKKHEIDTCQIICYYNLQQKYGMAYLLSNGNYGIIFNDKTSLTRIQGKSYLIYYRKEPHKLEVVPDLLKKKDDILDLCFKKLSKYKNQNVLVPFESDTFAKKIMQFENFFMIKLSNDIKQFFWQTDTLILRGNRWIKWKIGNYQGQSQLSNSQLSPQIKEKVSQIKRFFSQNREKDKQQH